MKKHCLPAALCLLAAPCLSSAVEAAPDQSDGPMVVTATRTSQTADAALASVTLITRDTIERLQAQSIQDLLRGVPGLDMSNNGGAGKATSLFLRGAASDQVLVLIDGIKVGSATLGTTAFQDIPIEHIERIEIVRGPMSSLYGAEAVGGVIQIFTRRGGGEVSPSVSLGSGSHQTYRGSAGLSGGGDRGWYSVMLSSIDTEGFNACRGKPFPDGGGCFTDEPDKDGHRNVSGTVRAGYRFDSNLEIDFQALRSESSTDFDGGFQNESETVQQVLGSSLRFAPLDRWQAALSWGQSRDEAENGKDGSVVSYFDTQRETVSFQNDVSLSESHLITVGADYQDDQIESSDDFVESSRDNIGLFSQYQGDFGKHNVQLSWRLDENEQFGNHDTGGLGWRINLNQDLLFTATYGTAFKAPSFNELYFPGFGNPDLEPETSRSLELGLRGETRGVGWSVAVYETQIDELIAYDASISAPANIDEARIRGVEAVVGGRAGSWDLQANLTLLDPKSRSADSAGNVLPRRSRQSARLDVDRDQGVFRIGASLYLVGERYEDLANTERLAGYATLDLRAELSLSQALRAQLRVENLLDKDYETAAYFNQPGQSFYFTLRYQM